MFIQLAQNSNQVAHPDSGIYAGGNTDQEHNAIMLLSTNTRTCTISGWHVHYPVHMYMCTCTCVVVHVGMHGALPRNSSINACIHVLIETRPVAKSTRIIKIRRLHSIPVYIIILP